MNTDGYIVIGTELDTKNLEQGLKKSINQLQKYKNEAEKLTEQKAKIELDLTEYEKEKQLIQEATDERLKFSETEEQVNWQLDMEKMELEKLNEKYSKQFMQLDEVNKKINKNTASQEMLKKQIEETNEKLKQTKGFDAIRTSINNVGNSMENIIHKVTRWGLAIFGIRGAYMGIRRAISVVSSDNEKVANSFEQIRHVIAGALLPVVQTVVNAIVKLMVYVNYLWKILTGRNLFNFADATKKSADSLKSGAGSSGKIAKNLKDARKQLAGFDEMNVLSDNVASAGGSGGSGGIGDVATDFANIFDKFKNIKIPKWLEKLGKILKTIKDNWKALIPVVAAFAALLLALKIAPFIHALTGATTALSLFKVGLGLAVAGAVLLIGEIINMIFNWDKMTKKQKILSVALAALGAAFIALGYAIATGLSVATLGIGALIALVIGLVATIVGFIAKLAKEEKAIKSVKKATDDLRESKEKLKEAEDDYISAVDNAKEKQKALKIIQEETGKSGERLYKKVQNGTIDYKNLTDKQKELYKAYKDNIDAQKKMKEASQQLKKSKQDVIDKTWEQKLAVSAEKGEYEKYRDTVIKAYQDGKISAQDAQKYISKAMTEMSEDSEQTFTKNIPDDIKKGLDPDKYRTTWQKFKRNWKSNVSEITKKVVIPITLGNAGRFLNAFDDLLEKIKKRATISFVLKGVSSGAGTGIGGKIKNAKGAVYYPSMLPKLAVGGVINQPGRGIPLGSAIGGEYGAEGVVPLTDSQQMALLGEAIGRYITINAQMNNYMNGRLISRELQKVQNQNDFAYNR